MTVSAEKVPSGLNRLTDSLKSAADAVRAIFFSALLLLVFVPPLAKRLLKAYGLQIAEVSSKDGIVLKQIEQSQTDAKAAGAAIASNQQNLPQIRDDLQAVLSQVKDATVKAQVSAAVQGIDQAVTNNALAVNSVGNSIVTQSQAYQTATTGTPTSDASQSTIEGWLYLGRVDAPQKTWLQNSPLSVFSAPLPLATGQSLILAGPALIRADAASGQHANASVIGALPKNTKLVIESVEPSHAKNGNWFIWVRVKSES